MPVSSVTKTDAHQLCFLNDGILRGYHCQLTGHLRKRHLLHFSVYDADHISVFFIKNHLRSRHADSRRKDTVVRARAAASLRVARNRNTHLRSVGCLDLLCKLVCDRRIFLRLNFFAVFFFAEFCVLF